MTDYETSAVLLFDGGWRADDRNELIREYGFTEEEIDKICEELAILAYLKTAKNKSFYKN